MENINALKEQSKRSLLLAPLSTCAKMCVIFRRTQKPAESADMINTFQCTYFSGAKRTELLKATGYDRLPQLPMTTNYWR